jgi:MFS family permease
MALNLWHARPKREPLVTLASGAPDAKLGGTPEPEKITGDTVPAAGGVSEAGRRSSARLSILLLLTMVLGYAVYAIDRTVLSGVLPTMAASLGLNNVQLGFLASAQYWGVLAVVFVAGSLSDRYGRMRIVLLGLVVFTAFTWLIGLSNGFAEAFAFRFVSGLGEGMFWPVAMASVASYFGLRKGFALGVFYVGFDVGSASGPALAGLALALTSNWRYAFFVAPLMGLAPVAMALLFQTRRANVENQNDRGMRLTLGRDALLLLRRSRNVKIIMLFAFLATWASVWQVVYLPYYFKAVLGYNLIYADFLVPVVAISGAAGKLVVGRLSDRWNRRSILEVTSVLVVLSYLVFFSSTNLYLVMLAAVSMGFFSSAIFPVMQALMADSCGTRALFGAGLGLSTTSQSVATALSSFISASLFSFGVGRALAASALVPAALMTAVSLLLRDPRNGAKD